MHLFNSRVFSVSIIFQELLCSQRRIRDDDAHANVWYITILNNRHAHPVLLLLLQLRLRFLRRFDRLLSAESREEKRSVGLQLKNGGLHASFIRHLLLVFSRFAFSLHNTCLIENKNKLCLHLHLLLCMSKTCYL